MAKVREHTLVLRSHPSLPILVDRDGRAVFEKDGFEWCERRPRRRGLYMAINIDGKSRRVHRLVLEAFVGSFAGMNGRHLNGDHLDNRLANLTWGTQAENCADTVRHGRSTRGEKNTQARLTRTSVLEIRAKRRAGSPLRALASSYRVSIGTVCDIVKRRTWKHV